MLTKLNAWLSKPRGLMGYTNYDRMVFYPFLGLIFAGLILLLS